MSLGNYYTSTAADYQTYPGAIRFASVTPATMDLVVQPNEELVVVFYSHYYFRSMGLKNNDPYPCTSNIPITCEYLLGYSNNRLDWMDKVVVRFNDSSYKTTKFHILIPDTQIANYHSYHWYNVGIYDKITKDFRFTYSQRYHRNNAYWYNYVPTYTSLTADIVGKAGSYKKNTSINVYNPTITNGASSYVFMCTQWSLF